MKKIFLGLTIIAAIFFTACDPIEDRYDMGDAITADEIEATVTVVQENGQNINYVKCECSSPITCKWTNGILSKASTYAELKMFTTGEQKITLLGLNPDGTEISKEFTVQIDAISENYPVEAEYGYFCGTGSKNWVWNTKDYTNTYGMGGWGADASPGWWGMTPDGGVTEMGWAGEGSGASMTLTLFGKALTKNKTDGTTASGSFDFDMDTYEMNYWDASAQWSIGKFYTSGVSVLLGRQTAVDADVEEYDIVQLTDSTMILAAPYTEVTWNQGTFWMFASEDYVNK